MMYKTSTYIIHEGFFKLNSKYPVYVLFLSTDYYNTCIINRGIG